MLIWTREEEFFYDTFHPAGVVKIKSGIDKSGQIKFWDYNLYYSGTRGADAIYDIPNIISHITARKTGGHLFISSEQEPGVLRITIQIHLQGKFRLILWLLQQEWIPWNSV
jgi:hypothetical protein